VFLLSKSSVTISEVVTILSSSGCISTTKKAEILKNKTINIIKQIFLIKENFYSFLNFKNSKTKNIIKAKADPLLLKMNKGKKKELINKLISNVYLK